MLINTCCRHKDPFVLRELDTQTAGFTKCRYPVLARRYVVRDGEVLHADLSSLELIDG